MMNMATRNLTRQDMTNLSPPPGYSKISSSNSDDLNWSIVMAYLNSFPLNELSVRIKFLTDGKMVSENVKKLVEISNPFLYPNVCFSLTEPASLFKQRIYNYFEKNGIYIRSGEDILLQKLSKLLNCSFVLFSIEKGIKKAVNFFPDNKGEDAGIIFFERSQMDIDRRQHYEFSYYIPEHIKKERQKLALGEILKRVNIEETVIQEMCELPDITENFLISLLKNNLGNVLPSIYASPSVLSKLADAGFETDPRKEDAEGKSAFFYAFKTLDSNIISLLYDYASSNSSQAEASVRNPDPEIVQNLKSLKEYLKSVEKDLDKDAEISDKSRCLLMLGDLCRFNEFQTAMCESMINVAREINNLDYTEKEYETLKRKETMLAILKTYSSYFDYSNVDSALSLNDDGHPTGFKNFFEHILYYDKLDLIATLLFFDNLYLLEERLILPSNEYLHAESIFFLFIFCKNILEEDQKHRDIHFLSRWIIYQERISFQRELKTFKEILENTKLSKDNVVDKIPHKAVQTLKNLPEVYNHFLTIRLQHYLNAATKLIVKDLKSTLAIERILHVTGESCKGSDFDSVQRILPLALPKDIIKCLKDIRNHITHIKSGELTDREKLEKNIVLFEGIRNELIELKQYLMPLFSAHKYEMDKFLLLHLEKSVSNEHKAILIKHIQDILPEISGIGSLNPNLSLWELWKENFQPSTFNVNCNGIDDVNIMNNSKHLIENIISAISELIENLNDPVSDENKEKLNTYFCYIENFLCYLINDRKLERCYHELMLMLKERKSIFTKFRENAGSISAETSFVEGEVVENSFPAEPEIPCDNSQQTMNHIDIFNTYGVVFDSEASVSTISNENESIGSKSERFEIRKNFKNGFSENQVPINMTSCDDQLLFNDGTVDIKTETGKFLDNYKKFFKDNIFSYGSDEDLTRRQIFFEDIEKYSCILKGHQFLSDEEKKCILESVSEDYKNAAEFKRQAKGLIEKQNEFTVELKNLLHKLLLNDRDIRKIKDNISNNSKEVCYKIIDNAHDYFLELEEVVKSKEISKKKHKLLCEKLKIPDLDGDILLKLVPRQYIINPGYKFCFLQDRINILKSILKDVIPSMEQLRRRATTPRRKMQVKEKIVQLYLNDSEIQLSTETLLFDCMAVLKKPKLKILWKKTKHLFNGINLKHILAHGHPLLESLGRLLDPYDLPSELVEKMMKLILDEDVIHYIKLISQTPEYSKGDRSFMEILRLSKFQKICQKIEECDHYYEYASLLGKKME